jgi:hypothetical protein
MANLFSLYAWELNFGQIIGDETQVLLGTSWGTTWELEKPLRTPWEQEKKQKNPFPAPPPPLPKEKNWIPHECMLSLLIDLMKLFVTIFGIG